MLYIGLLFCITQVGGLMKLRKLKLLYILIFLLCPLLCYAQSIEKFELKRSDNSSLIGYITRPQTETYPVAFIIHGSQCESVAVWHQDFSPIAMEIGAALVTLEKQGIYSENEFNEDEYDLTNTVEHRLEDHLFAIEKLREGSLLPHWNGRIIMIGGSEGGRVAAGLSARVPEIKVTALFTCGGGLTTIEELNIVFTKYGKSFQESDEEIEETLEDLNLRIHEILANPSLEKKFMDYTYKWWASHLSRQVADDLIQIPHPIFYAHGTADAVVPIESADALAELFKKIDKRDFYYYRVEGYGHDMRTFPAKVVEEMIKFIEANHQNLFPIESSY
jgi:esterase/lipase